MNNNSTTGNGVGAELEDIVNQAEYELGAARILKQNLTARQRLKDRLTNLIQEEKLKLLETILDMDERATYELDGKQVTGLAIPRHKVKQLLNNKGG